MGFNSLLITVSECILHTYWYVVEPPYGFFVNMYCFCWYEFYFANSLYVLKWLCCLFFLKKIEAGKQLEAFSLQLVLLAIWKQALHICHTQAASAMEGSPTQETSRLRRSTDKKQGSLDMQECLDNVNNQGPGDVCSQIEREFLHQVAHAEELAKVIEPGMNFSISLSVCWW